MMRVIVLVLVCSWSSVFAQSAATQPNPVQPNLMQPGADSVSADTTRIAMKQYIGAVSSLAANQRTVGIPIEYSSQIGNAPIAALGLNLFWWGDLLFHTSKLRSGATFSKLLNTYPNPRILENVQTEIQFGYALLETPSLKAYPLIGFGATTLSLDSLSRVSHLLVFGGAGVDYFQPNTPLVFTLQAAYNHTFNLRSAVETSGNQPGFTIKAGVSLWIRDKRTYWGWD